MLDKRLMGERRRPRFSKVLLVDFARESEFVTFFQYLLDHVHDFSRLWSLQGQKSCYQHQQ